MAKTPLQFPVIKSPFWAKTYGGYTDGHVKFFERFIAIENGKYLADPMAGQGFSSAKMAWAGALVHLSDINAGAIALANLRDPQLILNYAELNKYFSKKIAAWEKKTAKLKRRRRVFFPDWISTETKSEIQDFANHFEINAYQSPFQLETTFWRGPAEVRLALSLLVLAARSITCFRSSDNRTWLKRGGISPDLSVWEAVKMAQRDWSDFAKVAKPEIRHGGRLELSTANCETALRTQLDGKMDAVIVSPPYANRLDYSLLWAPEIAVISSAFEGSSEIVKIEQMGSTVVRNKWPRMEDVDSLPNEIRSALAKIGSDKAHASRRYYYPFFANYAISLQKSVRNWAGMLKKNGKLLVVLRDTVRKDYLFPTDVIVRETARASGLDQINSGEEPLIIRSHIGMVRHRRAMSSLQGLAQREWMLAFQR